MSSGCQPEAVVDDADRGRDVEAAAGRTGCDTLVVAAGRQPLGTSHVTVAAAWKRYGVKPLEERNVKTLPPTRSWRPKVADVIGLYLRAAGERDRAVCDEKSPDSRR